MTCRGQSVFLLKGNLSNILTLNAKPDQVSIHSTLHILIFSYATVYLCFGDSSVPKMLQMSHSISGSRKSALCKQNEKTTEIETLVIKKITHNHFSGILDFFKL